MAKVPIGWDYCTERYNAEYRDALMRLFDKSFRYKNEYERVTMNLTEKGGRYLDLGCGDGELTIRCAERIGAKDVWGVDLVDPKLSEASRRGIRVIRGRADVPLPSDVGSFDVITANQVIEHVDDTDGLIKNIYNSLVPGGYAILSTNNLAAFHWIVMFILGINPPTCTPSDEMCAREFGNYQGERLHHRLFTLPGLVKTLKYFGFEVEKTVGTYWFPLPIPLARMLCAIDKVHAACITVKVRKPCSH